MRARNLKPKFFKNPILAPADPLYSLIFEGLWCLADRNGRLEDIPFGIHLEVNPGRAFDGTERALDWLHEKEFISRYQVGGKRFIQVLQFSKHQQPHHREPSLWPPDLLESDLPKAQGFVSNKNDQKPGASSGQTAHATDVHRPSASSESCSLNPESLILNPSIGGSSPGPAPGKQRRRRNPPDPNRKATTRMPEEYMPGVELRAWAAEQVPDVNFEYELGKCRDYTFRNARSDWDAVLRNWLRTAQEHAGTRRQSAPANGAKHKTRTREEIDQAAIDAGLAAGKTDDEIYRELQVVPIERISARRAERLRGANGQH